MKTSFLIYICNFLSYLTQSSIGCNGFNFIAFISYFIEGMQTLWFCVQVYVQICLGSIQSYQKKNQKRPSSDLVTCREQQNYSGFHLSFFQNISFTAKERCQLLLKAVRFCSIEKRLLVYCLIGGQNGPSYILVFLTFCHLVVCWKQDSLC